MKIYFKIGLFFWIVSMLFSCEKKYNNEDIIKFLNSDDKTEIMKGCSLLEGEKDTIFVKYLFRDIEDIRISHAANFYGITVYEARMGALKRISGLNPPNKITYMFDSLNTHFYRKWALEKNLLNK